MAGIPMHEHELRIRKNARQRIQGELAAHDIGIGHAPAGQEEEEQGDCEAIDHTDIPAVFIHENVIKKRYENFVVKPMPLEAF